MINNKWHTRKSTFFLGWYLFLLLPLAALLPSCKGKKADRVYRIAFSQCIGNDAWRQTMLKDMQRELSFYNNISFLYADANGNTKTQVKQIDSLYRQNIDLLLVSPNEVDALAPLIGRVFDAGIPVVEIDRRTNSPKITAFIGASNFEVGQNAGRYAVTLLKGKGNIIEITGLPENASYIIDRHRGFMDVIAKFPQIKFLKKLNTFSKVDGNEPEVERFLKEHAEVDLIYAQNDIMAYDAYKLYQKLHPGNKIKIIGIDGLASKGGGLDLVANQILSATVLYPNGGQEAIQTAVNILEGKPYKKENFLVTTIIDSVNVRVMQLQYAKMKEQQKDIDRRQAKIEQQEIISKNQTTIIVAISATLALALIFGGILFYFLRENKKINATLARQNKEISEQRNQLIVLGEQAREANEAKINFFTNISHEFRTPLTLILASLDDLSKNTKLDYSTKQYIDLIQKNTLRLLKLINEILDFRKIETDKMQVQVAETNLVAFIEDILASFKGLAKKSNIDLRLISKHRNLPVWIDPSMLDKVLFNLLSNAFKFTAINGYIHLTLEKNDQQNTAVIKVEDNGAGMSEQTAGHIFELFYQGNVSDKLGSGIGLSLSQKLIRLHHGNITVQSKKNAGTLFTITLPLGREHYSEGDFAIEGLARPDNPFNERIYVPEAENAITSAQPTGWESPEVTILVIEDNADLRKFLYEKLNGRYIVLQADNGVQGIQLAFENVPDIIISDIAMPGKDGIAVMNTVKSDIRTSHIPVILLTAKGEIHQQIEGMKNNADAYIVKPFNFLFLEETIRSLLKNREILREHYTSELPIETKSATPRKLDKKFINDFTSLVESNIGNEELSIDSLCKSLNISRVQLYRKANALLKCNVNDYIQTVRFQKAKLLLGEGNLSISEIAFKTGFSSLAYFSSAFKQRFGISPSEYRDKKRP